MNHPALKRRTGDHAMTSATTMPDSSHPAAEMAVDLFDNWLDPIETTVRRRRAIGGIQPGGPAPRSRSGRTSRARDFIEEAHPRRDSTRCLPGRATAKPEAATAAGRGRVPVSAYLAGNAGLPAAHVRRLRRPHPQGREACRPAGASADQIRAGDHSQDREGARNRYHRWRSPAPTT